MVTVQAPYGTWPSPIDAELVATHDGRPDHLGAVGQEVWWTAPRPDEGGRRAWMRFTADGAAPAPALPAPWDVRSRVIEYGGCPWAGAARPSGGPLMVFVHHADQRLYRFEPDQPGASPHPLTPLSPLGPPSAGGGLRWADPVVLPERGEVWCVLEEFTGPAPTDVRRVLAAVPLDGSAAQDRDAVRELTPDTHHFVTGPRISPDGRHAAWLAWDHPRMPWDGTELRLAEVGGDGWLESARTVLGGPRESVAQTEWAADGSLLAVSDRSGWWNLYRVDPENGPPLSLCPRAEEFGDALWQIGRRWFVPLPTGPLAVLHGRGPKSLGILDPEGGELVDAPGPWTEWSPSLAAVGSRVVGIAASPRSGCEIVELDTCTGHSRVLAEPHRDPVDPAYYPEPLIRAFNRPDGHSVPVHVYPPHHPGRTAPDGELPPYVIRVHGGPTGRSPLALDLETAYFTSRGIGVADVDYGGSTGYGRAYRERLREQWGVVDVEDCAAVARALAEEGTADRARIAVRGGSAGGWTAAVSLVAPAAEGVYACAVISYPVLDLAGWADSGTHDFESRYLESLVGPRQSLPARSRERSPVHGTDRISVPFLLMQGLDDVICPPAQSERFMRLMPPDGPAHAYLTFEGEGHGFRRAETIVRALEAEMALYRTVFGLERPDVGTLPAGG
ncbi:prolyl oligopeptidase family serine peptidase [Streptomyces sp. 549]|uniref:prolyl oligopeptidase family serine peptidase n=1 Tax=Streptomyces sp. 549 TaxID=3049076 RepID=UPI0024C3E993|nr:prolyl oligopeptidase family serine peptidase [Streptomyces sp. 549]MDK1472127.1 prolyl oligopeptidase family serine peptidase [Streptomyces sp. 549]